MIVTEHLTVSPSTRSIVSLRTALLVVGVIVVGLFLLEGFLAMGPLGWIVFGTLIGIGIVQVYRNRRRADGPTDDEAIFCANCGEPIDPTIFEDEMEDDDPDWSLSYCRNCGAPVPKEDVNRLLEMSTDPGRTRQSCPDCGAPNEFGRTACEYCNATL